MLYRKVLARFFLDICINYVFSWDSNAELNQNLDLIKDNYISYAIDLVKVQHLTLISPAVTDIRHFQDIEVILLHQGSFAYKMYYIITPISICFIIDHKYK